MTHAKFHFNQLMLTLIFGIRASEPPPHPRAWRTTKKAGPDRVKSCGLALSHLGEGGGFCSPGRLSLIAP